MIRLLHCDTWEFKELNDRELESYEYATLSHTWLHEGSQLEVQYQDVVERIASENAFVRNESDREPPERADWRDTSKDNSWNKIEMARKRVLNDSRIKMEWIWIDSCCIDTDNAQEHMAAINSMYKWYEKSQVCIAHLSDIGGTIVIDCRWFKRGWTLQELIAPPNVHFYNDKWKYCGSRNEHTLKRRTGKIEDASQIIADLSHVDLDVLKESDTAKIKHMLSRIPACRKMYWASDRETTKVEDRAYCLLGIFLINHMYLKSGEGKAAFIRLQEEILDRTSDPTLFAWQVRDPSYCDPENTLDKEILKGRNPCFGFNDDLHGMFACDPHEFKLARDIEPSRHVMYSDPISVTSKGVKFASPLWLDDPTLRGPESPYVLSLDCYKKDKPSVPLGIQLRWIGGNIYARTNIEYLEMPIDLNNAQTTKNNVHLFPSQDNVYVTRKVHYLEDNIDSLHRNAIRIPEQTSQSNFRMERKTVSPGFLWNQNEKLFMTKGAKFPVGYAAYNIFVDNQTVVNNVSLLFGLDYQQKPWVCLIEPGSQLAALQVEMRHTYIHRIWSTAIRERNQKITLDTGEACPVIEALFDTEAEFQGQPIFSLKLRLVSLRRKSVDFDTINPFTRPQDSRYDIPSQHPSVIRPPLLEVSSPVSPPELGKTPTTVESNFLPPGSLNSNSRYGLAVSDSHRQSRHTPLGPAEEPPTALHRLSLSHSCPPIIREHSRPLRLPTLSVPSTGVIETSNPFQTAKGPHIQNKVPIQALPHTSYPIGRFPASSPGYSVSPGSNPANLSAVPPLPYTCQDLPYVPVTPPAANSFGFPSPLNMSPNLPPLPPPASNYAVQPALPIDSLHNPPHPEAQLAAQGSGPQIGLSPNWDPSPATQARTTAPMPTANPPPPPLPGPPYPSMSTLSLGLPAPMMTRGCPQVPNVPPHAANLAVGLPTSGMANAFIQPPNIPAPPLGLPEFRAQPPPPPLMSPSVPNADRLLQRPRRFSSARVYGSY